MIPNYNFVQRLIKSLNLNINNLLTIEMTTLVYNINTDV